jgi:hypothetical protein
MPGNCPAWLRPSAARLWKTFRSKPNTIPAEARKCSPSERNAVRIHNGMVFAFTTESRSPSTGFPTGWCVPRIMAVKQVSDRRVTPIGVTPRGVTQVRKTSENKPSIGDSRGNASNDGSIQRITSVEYLPSVSSIRYNPRNRCVECLRISTLKKIGRGFAGSEKACQSG